MTAGWSPVDRLCVRVRVCRSPLCNYSEAKKEIAPRRLRTNEKLSRMIMGTALHSQLRTSPPELRFVLSFALLSPHPIPIYSVTCFASRRRSRPPGANEVALMDVRSQHNGEKVELCGDLHSRPTDKKRTPLLLVFRTQRAPRSDGRETFVSNLEKRKSAHAEGGVIPVEKTRRCVPGIDNTTVA